LRRYITAVFNVMQDSDSDSDSDVDEEVAMRRKLRAKAKGQTTAWGAIKQFAKVGSSHPPVPCTLWSSRHCSLPELMR